MNSNIYKRFLTDICYLTALIVFGSLGFSLIEHWPILDCLFMTVITLTTVGYDEVHHLDNNGKIYVIFLIILGSGVVLYILSDLVQLFLEINFKGKRMKDKIKKIHSHQIVCGFGRTGQEVCQHFKQNKLEFVIIESDQKRFDYACEMGYLAIFGDASNDEILALANVETASGIVCALPDDTANTFIALSARGLNDHISIVSRAANPGSESKLKRVGAKMVISPYVICGRRMASAITHPLVCQFLDVIMHSPEYDLRMEQLLIQEESSLIGSTLKHANIKQMIGVMILAVYQNGGLITNPPPEMVFECGDELIALGTDEDLGKLKNLVNKKNK